MTYGGQLRSRSRWKLQPKAAALTGFGDQPDAPAHPFHGFANDSQPDAGARVSGDVMKAFEQTEDFFLMLSRDADAIVFDPDAHGGIQFFGGDADVWVAPLIHKFQAIANEIGKDLLESGKIGTNPQ